MYLPSTRPDGNRFVIPCRGLQEYLEVVRRHAGRGDVWVGGRPSTSYRDPVQARLFGDVDEKNLSEALEATRRLALFVEDKYGTIPALVFTGGKGFHLHAEHGSVSARPVVYRDAVLSLLSAAGGGLDSGPLQSAWAAPRVPYTVASGSLAQHGEVLHVVPVDVSWGVGDVVEASRACAYHPFSVPFVDGLAEDLSGPCASLEARRAAWAAEGRRPPTDDLAKAALGFCEHLGVRLGDGRRRVLRSLLVPALLATEAGNVRVVADKAMDWVARSGAQGRLYESFVDSCIQGSRMDDGSWIAPMGVQKFLSLNADLRVGSHPPPKRIS